MFSFNLYNILHALFSKLVIFYSHVNSNFFLEMGNKTCSKIKKRRGVCFNDAINDNINNTYSFTLFDFNHFDDGNTHVTPDSEADYKSYRAEQGYGITLRDVSAARTFRVHESFTPGMLFFQIFVEVCLQFVIFYETLFVLFFS